MKKLQFLLATTAILSFSACKKSDSTAVTLYTCTTCKTTPDAKAANDGSSKGIYKGVMIGSSGTIMFDIANNGSTITAVMVVDGITVNLTANITWVAGQPYVAPFTGTLSGSAVSITFSIGALGQTPTIVSSNIPGHPNATFTIIKETSNSLVECFEGTYSTTRPETGIFNLILSRTALIFGGASRKTGTTTSGGFDGTISNNHLYETVTHTDFGTLNADQLDGSFTDSNGSIVTITGRRTL